MSGIHHDKESMIKSQKIFNLVNVYNFNILKMIQFVNYYKRIKRYWQYINIELAIILISLSLGNTAFI